MKVIGPERVGVICVSDIVNYFTGILLLHVFPLLKHCTTMNIRTSYPLTIPRSQ